MLAQHNTAQACTAQPAQACTAQACTALLSTAQHSTAEACTAQACIAQHSIAQQRATQLEIGRPCAQEVSKAHTDQHSMSQPAQGSPAWHSAAQQGAAQHSATDLVQKSGASCAVAGQTRSAGGRSHGPVHHADSACHIWCWGCFCQFGAKMGGWGAEWYSRGGDHMPERQGCTHQPYRQGIFSVSHLRDGILVSRCCESHKRLDRDGLYKIWKLQHCRWKAHPRAAHS